MANLPTSVVGFSVTGISALLDLHALMKDWNGDPARSNPDTIVFSPKYISKALQIFGSDKEPFTAENQDNAIKRRLAGHQADSLALQGERGIILPRRFEPERCVVPHAASDRVR